MFISPAQFASHFEAYRLQKKVALLYDENTQRLFSKTIERELARQTFEFQKFVVKASESSKTLRTAEHLYGELIKKGIDRKTTLIAIGGGVIGDLGGFVAASYQRGIPLVQVPTTLLAMVDSAIGGKVAVNHSLGKNMVGFFYEPVFTAIDTEFLQTLPKRDFYSGLAESIKYALIQDSLFLDALERDFDKLIALESDAIERMISRSVKNKIRIVKKDFKETRGLRALLNFGHTFAHAFETVTNYKAFRHGEAVAFGMVCAAALSKNLGLLSSAELERIIFFLKRFEFPKTVLKKHFLEIDAQAVQKAMQSDKKKENQIVRFVLLKKIGAAFVCEEKISARDIQQALNEAKENLK